MIRIIKMIGIYLVAIIGVTLIIVILFLNLSPQFGMSPTKKQKIEYAKSGHYQEGQFKNQNHTVMNIHFWELLNEYFKSAENRKPKKDIKVEKIDLSTIESLNTNETTLIWFGHSAFLLKIDDKIILIDPMLGQSPSPISFLGTKRYSKELPIEIDSLPFIDAVILSHDHYDHLDKNSIQKLREKVGRFYTPLGVGNHLVSWGVSIEKITELNWWESIDFENLKLVCTPARHFSGRGLFDRASTLWCSWVIRGKKSNIFFSGDSGYDIHFKEIGDKFGPFDISLMECGQYHKDWQLFHMMPEETVQASIDLKSKLILPIHWGAFTLALHDWTDPIERVTKVAESLDLHITTPKIGEPVIVGNTTFPILKWWLQYSSDSNN